jgi:hypothetical protein
MRIPAAGADRKFAVFGAFDYATSQVHWQMRPRKDSQAFITFLEQLRHTWPAETLSSWCCTTSAITTAGDPCLVATMVTPALPVLPARLYAGVAPAGARLALCQREAQLPPLMGRLAGAVGGHCGTLALSDGLLS